MGILDRLLHGDSASDRLHKERVDAAVERVVKLNPSLGLARRAQAHLASAVATAIHYVDALVAGLPAPHEATAAAWASDAYIHAFFVAPDDVARLLSRSADLRAHFEQNADLPVAHAVLGMNLTERHTLGVALEGETLRQDVPRTTVSFSDHQVRICARTDAELRQEIVRRMIDQLALEGLAAMASDKSRRDMLEKERALLKTRLQLLERQGTGLRAVLGSEAPAAGDLGGLQAELEQNDRQLQELGLRSDTLERKLDRVCAVFTKPHQHLYVESKRLRLDRMNVVMEKHSQQTGEDLEVRTARIPGNPPLLRAFALVRFARADLLPAENMFDVAMRLLSQTGPS